MHSFFWKHIFMFLYLNALLKILHCVLCETDLDYPLEGYTVRVVLNVTYIDPQTGHLVSYKSDRDGYYGENKVSAVSGIGVHALTVSNRTDACDPLQPSIARSEPWIALIQRGICNFSEKIRNAAVRSNASAVLVYNDDGGRDAMKTMTHNYKQVVAALISQELGRDIANLIDNGTRVMLYLYPGKRAPMHSAINKTSVLFVSISFIVLMIISLAWLVFYYIQRFRYAHAKDRLARRLLNAAKKALTRIPVRTLKAGDQEIQMEFDSCAVCIENFRAGDVIRILPCKHIFHKSCIDPWLLDQRTCPMCKLDIVKAYGCTEQLQGSSSMESVHNWELEATTSGNSVDLGTREAVVQVHTVDMQPHSDQLSVVMSDELQTADEDHERESLSSSQSQRQTEGTSREVLLFLAPITLDGADRESQLA
ncbi:PREDICTED: RING finger protein 150-like [Priapulus caudatus]|uniref:RING finger protein 150-like n=1 Tax=Priapulus caudatus TaxID=37621 RepID=A0ABM1E7W1_PRICU|nr:PREDICTED: RING finger protein 150-like [Priapulus caudatus]